MSNPRLFRLNRLTVVDVTGKDAGTIVQNLTTNEAGGLSVDEGRESFVTDVRGKTLAHVNVFQAENMLRLIGPAGQAERIVSHLDRYTIREDATPVIRDDDFQAMVLAPEVASPVCGGQDGGPHQGDQDVDLRRSVLRVGDLELESYTASWLGAGTVVVLVPQQDADQVVETIRKASDARLEQLLEVGDEASFHAARTVVGFPWFGIDLDESNLPQEADRDDFAISFTKGCYLGQETVARLDAMGQVQKKLVHWAISGAVPEPGAKLFSGEKNVGRLTSVAADAQGGAIAIGTARRSHFDAGATAAGVIESTGSEFAGTVL